jgi:hypothetical protein
MNKILFAIGLVLVAAIGQSANRPIAAKVSTKKKRITVNLKKIKLF